MLSMTAEDEHERIVSERQRLEDLRDELRELSESYWRAAYWQLTNGEHPSQKDVGQ